MKYHLIEQAGNRQLSITDKGIELADKLCDKYDCSLNPRVFLDHVEVSAEHIVKIKREIEKAIIDRSRPIDSRDVFRLVHEPWSVFRCNNIILRDEKIANPDYNNGMIKAEPFGFYNEGILVGTSEVRREIKVLQSRIIGEENIIAIDAHVAAMVPFYQISAFDPEGSIDNPYPTFYCKFWGKNPYSGLLFFDQETARYYKEDELL